MRLQFVEHLAMASTANLKFNEPLPMLGIVHAVQEIHVRFLQEHPSSDSRSRGFEVFPSIKLMTTMNKEVSDHCN